MTIDCMSWVTARKWPQHHAHAGAGGETPVSTEAPMQCPSCGSSDHAHKVLEEDLHVIACNGCGGYWLRATEYWQWLRRHGPPRPEKQPDTAITVTDSKRPKTCPECGTILTAYQVGHGADFAIEHCALCGGVWFDKNEWEALHSRNLHDHVHRIFAASWQHALRATEAAKTHEQRVHTLLGDQDYERARELKEWLRSHPRRAVILAYLEW
ncbi:MAG: hypothetical protein GF331_12800 [Chitinivibrionales bacterium]|nr:hypothetical protein [Chitinivibrionales bacterium]